MNLSGSMLTSTVALSAALLLAGCDQSASNDEGGSAATPGNSARPNAMAVEIDHYEGTRGRITALPVEGSPTERDLRIHHENMPEFKNKNGNLGMNAMIMPFPLGEGVSLEGLSVGQPVEFDWEVNWEGSPPYYVVAIRPLPEDTVLDFEKPAEQAPGGD